MLKSGMWDVVKHEKEKLEMKDPMVHIMVPATNQTKCVVCEAPDLEVATLTGLQYADLTREQHPVSERNRILLAIQEGKFENEIYVDEDKNWHPRNRHSAKLSSQKQEVDFSMEDVSYIYV
jgi:hypothetical protein